jgi:hypothetical protein
MKKPFEFTERSKDVFCSNPKCASVRGGEGVARMPIKENVVSRSPDGKPLVCYDCAVYLKTGKTRKQRKDAEERRKIARQKAREAQELNAMTAKA